MAQTETVQAERCSSCGSSMAAHRPSKGCPYNGWGNYETWCVGLWIDNEEPAYRYRQRLVKAARHEAADQADAQFPRSARGILADMLKEWIEADAPELPASMFSDLLNAALGEVDWHELAASYLEEAE